MRGWLKPYAVVVITLKPQLRLVNWRHQTEEQLVYASSRQRVFVSHNIKHFPGLHAAWVEAGRSHEGIIILVGHSAVSVWLRRMETLLHLFSVEELENSLFFLGAEFDSPA